MVDKYTVVDWLACIHVPAMTYYLVALDKLLNICVL